MKRKLLITPFSLISLDLSDAECMRIASEIGFDGLEINKVLTPEFANLADEQGLELVHPQLPYEPDGTVDERYIDFLLARGLTEVSMMNTETAQQMHCLFHAIRNEPEETFRYKGLPAAFGSYDMAMRAAETAQFEARIAAKYGLKVFYHNHTHEFRIDHGEYIMDTYLKNTPDNVVMQVDVGWALCAGIDLLAWMARWSGRIGSLHVKSCNWVIGPEALGMTCPRDGQTEGITRDHMSANQAFAESPQGPMALNIVDWTDIFSVAESIGCRALIHERERIYIPGDILACVREDYRHLRQCLDSMG